LTVAVGATLTLTLKARNDGRAPVTLGGALHSYFAVGDAARARVTGLDGRPYVDQLHPAARPVQKGPVVFQAETDRVYDDPGPACAVEDPAWGRRLVIEKSGSRSTVVWNPWTEKARRLADLGEDQFKDFVCVETANALTDTVTVPAGGVHALQARIRAEIL
jgi:glucose-6-phosphate 1-epimerase